MSDIDRLVERFNSFNVVVRLSILLVNFVIFFGMVGPSMISSNSTIAVWVGIVLLIADLGVSYVFAKQTIKELMK